MTTAARQRVGRRTPAYKVRIGASEVALTELIGSGGEAHVFAIPSDAALVAKVYKKPSSERAAKLALMVKHPPTDPTAHRGHTSIAWPRALVTDAASGIIGFTMPRLSRMPTLKDVMLPRTRRQSAPELTYLYLHGIARNLAAAASAVHDVGHVIGDVNESNVLVGTNAFVTLIDTDSFQVSDPRSGQIFRCPVGKPEYTPPELQGRLFAGVDRTARHDQFGLGVLLFQLLANGVHPYDGIYRGTGESPDLPERIRCGWFPHGGPDRNLIQPAPRFVPFDGFPKELQRLFIRCFGHGACDPSQRPAAREWLIALDELKRDLRTCKVNQQHVFWRADCECVWCALRARIGFDAFPPKGSPVAARAQNQTRSARLAQSPSSTPPKRTLPSPPVATIASASAPVLGSLRDVLVSPRNIATAGAAGASGWIAGGIVGASGSTLTTLGWIAAFAATLTLAFVVAPARRSQGESGVAPVLVACVIFLLILSNSTDPLLAPLAVGGAAAAVGSLTGLLDRGNRFRKAIVPARAAAVAAPLIIAVLSGVVASPAYSGGSGTPSWEYQSGDGGGGKEADPGVPAWPAAPTTIRPLVARTSIEGELTFDRRFEEYAYAGTAGEWLTVQTRASFDSYLELYAHRDGSRELLLENDDSDGDTNARIATSLPHTGTYILRVRSYSSSATGRYSITASSSVPSTAPSSSVPSTAPSSSVPSTARAAPEPRGESRSVTCGFSSLYVCMYTLASDDSRFTTIPVQAAVNQWHSISGRDGWYEVTLEDGRSGFVRAADLARLHLPNADDVDLP